MAGFAPYCRYKHKIPLRYFFYEHMKTNQRFQKYYNNIYLMARFSLAGCTYATDMNTKYLFEVFFFLKKNKNYFKTCYTCFVVLKKIQNVSKQSPPKVTPTFVKRIRYTYIINLIFILYLSLEKGRHELCTYCKVCYK